MNIAFKYRNNRLFCENVDLSTLPKNYGSPIYVYSKAQLKHNYHQFFNAFKFLSPTICYALKANANTSLLKEYVKVGSGADVVSGGELLQALKAGFPPEKIVFAGVGKRRDEIRLAIQNNIEMLNLESEQELAIVDEEAALQKKIVKISVRINPDINVNTHPYISTGSNVNKFGIEIEQAFHLYREMKSLNHVRAVGVHIHLGSQITDPEPFTNGAKTVLEFISRLKKMNIYLSHIDFGGGLGVDYEKSLHNSDDLILAQYAEGIIPLLKSSECKIFMEPGRFLIANTGVLLTEVLYTKQNSQKKFVIVDAGMSDLIRPSLYHSYHEILKSIDDGNSPIEKYDVVGPICESGDFFAKDRELAAVQPGEILSVMTAGAYGYSQASNYNLRGRPAELLIDDDRVTLIRERELLI